MGGDSRPIFQPREQPRTFGEVREGAGSILGDLEQALGGSLAGTFGLGEEGPIQGAQELFTQALTGDLKGTPFFSSALEDLLAANSQTLRELDEGAFQASERPQFGTEAIRAAEVGRGRREVAGLSSDLSLEFLEKLAPVLNTGVSAGIGASGAFLGAGELAARSTPEEQAVNASFSAPPEAGKSTSGIGSAFGALIGTAVAPGVGTAAGAGAGKGLESAVSAQTVG